MSNASNSEFASYHNEEFQKLVDGAVQHNPQTFNEESERLFNSYNEHDIEPGIVTLSFLIPRSIPPYWNLRRITIAEPLYEVTERKPPVYYRRASQDETKVRPLVNLTMSPAKDGKNLVAYWYANQGKPNAVVLSDNKPARILTSTRLI